MCPSLLLQPKVAGKMGTTCISSPSHCPWSSAPPVKEGTLITEESFVCVTARQAMTFNRGSQLELMACSHTDWSLMLSISDGEDSVRSKHQCFYTCCPWEETRYNGHIKIAALSTFFFFFRNMAQSRVFPPLNKWTRGNQIHILPSGVCSVWYSSISQE